LSMTLDAPFLAISSNPSNSVPLSLQNLHIGSYMDSLSIGIHFILGLVFEKNSISAILTLLRNVLCIMPFGSSDYTSLRASAILGCFGDSSEVDILHIL